ncbi:hypothetical protein [Hamadaea tsunoensis]|uniref:hypothetical protein n=1 Tax=Hamadaea tsunoensis TaxID=53368 RepID=UPI000425E3AD|nr:hypothetical protein [Hamadaea tsunoensis]
MRIYAATPRAYAIGTLMNVVFCALICVLLNLVLPFGWAALAALILLPVFLVRMVVASRRRWVFVGPQGIAWRTPARAGFDAAPTGSVVLDQVTDYHIGPQALGRRPGQAVTLTLADGGTVKLPIWAPVGQPFGPQEEMIRALRRTLRTAG